MRKPETRTIDQHWLTCDRCGRRMEKDGDIVEWQETITIRFRAGEHGAFEAGQWYEADFCQHCVKDVLGRHLRITDDDALHVRRQPATRPRNTFQQWEIERRIEADWLIVPFIELCREHELRVKDGRKLKTGGAA